MGSFLHRRFIVASDISISLATCLIVNPLFLKKRTYSFRLILLIFSSSDVEDSPIMDLKIVSAFSSVKKCLVSL